MKRAVFLDKDGTLVVDVPYNVDPARIELASGARGACVAWKAAGYALVVVTNQSGIARGLFAADALDAVEARLSELTGVAFDGFYHCPHAEGCDCRKPMPGMLLQAACDLDIDLTRSWMVGDILNDVAAGRAARCRTILIDNGNETEWVGGPDRTPHHKVATLAEAATLILADAEVAA